METARRVAAAMRAVYGWCGTPCWEQLLRAASDAGARVDADADLPEPIREVYVNGLRGIESLIALRRGLRRPWQRWLLAHGLGHCLLHEGNHMYLETIDQCYWVERQEREAEVFAGALIFGDLPRPIAGVGDVLDLAEWADVPLTVTLRWTRLAGLDASPAASLDRQDAALQAGLAAGERREPPWAPFLAAAFAGVTMLHADLNGDGVVQALHWLAGAAPGAG